MHRMKPLFFRGVKLPDPAMSEGFGTLPGMAIKSRAGTAIAVFVLLVSACSSDEPTTLAELEGEDQGSTTVPVTLPPQPSTTTTEATVTTVAEETSTTTETPVAPTTSIVTDGETPVELTWAEEGSIEADIEQAFWPALDAGR